MMNNNLLPISKFGLEKILYALGAFVVLLILDCDILSFIAFVLTLFLVYIYRNPEREIALFEKNSVLSPVDGRVIAIEDLENSEYAYKIVIESEMTNVGVLRAPMNAKVLHKALVYGAKMSAKSKLAEKINENATLVFEDDNSNKLKVKHLSKQSFESIALDTREGKNLLQSARYGFSLNGITTIYLPHNFRVNVSVGNELNASQSLIGYFS